MSDAAHYWRPSLYNLRSASMAARAEVADLLAALQTAPAAYRAGTLPVASYRAALESVADAGNRSLAADRELWAANIEMAKAVLDVESVEVVKV